MSDGSKYRGFNVFTITGTSMPNVIAASNYQQNINDEINNWNKIKLQRMENELKNYHKLNNEQQELLKYLIENKQDIISKIGEEEFNNKLRLNRKYINTYINHLTGLTNAIERLKNLIENQKEN